MRNKILNYILFLLVITSLVAFLFTKEKAVTPVQKTKTLPIKPVIEKQFFSKIKKPYLYDNSKNVKDILPELLDEAKNNDAKAAYRIVELSSICGIINAAITQNDIDGFIVSLGEAMLGDSSGRVFFNQLLTLPGISVDSFDEFSDIINNGIKYCEGYDPEKNEYSKIFHLLNIAAKNGNAEAKVFLWKMPLPKYMQAKTKNFQNPQNLDYLEYYQENKIWQETRIGYLFDAAKAGEEKAWVLLGDVLSSDEWVLPNLVEAYKYYYAAFKYYQFPFLITKLTALENYLTTDEIKEGKFNGENLFWQFN